MSLPPNVVAELRGRGIDPIVRPTPAHLVPMSDIVSTLVEPWRRRLEDPNNPRRLSVLATLAALAWNVSRLVRTPEFVGTAAEALRSALRGSAEGFDIAHGMFTHAFFLDPEDTRMIVSTSVEVDGRAVHFKAAYVMAPASAVR